MNAVNDLVITCRQRGIVIAAQGEALRVEGPDEALTEDLLNELKEHKPDLLAALQNENIKLDAILTEACRGVEGITPSQFRSLLSAEDVTDIRAGDIPAVPTLRAYAQSFAEGIQTGRIRVLAAEMRP